MPDVQDEPVEPPKVKTLHPELYEQMSPPSVRYDHLENSDIDELWPNDPIRPAPIPGLDLPEQLLFVFDEGQTLAESTMFNYAKIFHNPDARVFFNRVMPDFIHRIRNHTFSYNAAKKPRTKQGGKEIKSQIKELLNTVCQENGLPLTELPIRVEIEGIKNRKLQTRFIWHDPQVMAEPMQIVSVDPE